MGVLKEIDSWLAFLQSIGQDSQPIFMQMPSSKGADIIDLIGNLNEILSNPRYIQARARLDAEWERRVYREALKLEQTKHYVLRFTDKYKYSKFDELGDFGFSKEGVLGVYRVAASIRNDIAVARDWLESYKQFEKLVNMMPKSVDITQQQLVTLGKSILARAVELTPKDTGYLRKSATLVAFKDHIQIAYLAPYASYVHDNLEISHPVHPSNPNCGGRAKFLEQAVQEFFPDKTSWVDVDGSGRIQVTIGINPLYIEYLHYN